jgi:hypothetical protein
MAKCLEGFGEEVAIITEALALKKPGRCIMPHDRIWKEQRRIHGHRRSSMLYLKELWCFIYCIQLTMQYNVGFFLHEMCYARYGGLNKKESNNCLNLEHLSLTEKELNEKSSIFVCLFTCFTIYTK